MSYMMHFFRAQAVGVQIVYSSLSGRAEVPISLNRIRMHVRPQCNGETTIQWGTTMQLRKLDVLGTPLFCSLLQFWCVAFCGVALSCAPLRVHCSRLDKFGRHCALGTSRSMGGYPTGVHTWESIVCIGDGVRAMEY